MITTKQIAWAAGLWEGKGSCSWTSSTRNCQEVSVKQKDPWVLQELATIFGGKVSTVGGSNKLSSAQQYRWRLFGANARGFLMTIYTFLSPRRKEQVKACGVFQRKEGF